MLSKLTLRLARIQLTGKAIKKVIRKVMQMREKDRVILSARERIRVKKSTECDLFVYVLISNCTVVVVDIPMKVCRFKFDDE